jgi:hypothetical protein
LFWPLHKSGHNGNTESSPDRRSPLGNPRPVRGPRLCGSRRSGGWRGAPEARPLPDLRRWPGPPQTPPRDEGGRIPIPTGTQAGEPARGFAAMVDMMKKSFTGRALTIGFRIPECDPWPVGVPGRGPWEPRTEMRHDLGGPESGLGCGRGGRRLRRAAGKGGSEVCADVGGLRAADAAGAEPLG